MKTELRLDTTFRVGGSSTDAAFEADTKRAFASERERVKNSVTAVRALLAIEAFVLAAPLNIPEGASVAYSITGNLDRDGRGPICVQVTISNTPPASLERQAWEEQLVAAGNAYEKSQGDRPTGVTLSQRTLDILLADNQQPRYVGERKLVFGPDALDVVVDDAVPFGEAYLTGAPETASLTVELTEPAGPADPAQDGETRESDVASIHVTPTALELAPKKKQDLTAHPQNAAGNTVRGRRITWESNDEDIATVSAHGVVHAHTEGVCIITATCEGRSATVDVTVEE